MHPYVHNKAEVHFLHYTGRIFLDILASDTTAMVKKVQRWLQRALRRNNLEKNLLVFFYSSKYPVWYQRGKLGEQRQTGEDSRGINMARKITHKHIHETQCVICVIFVTKVQYKHYILKVFCNTLLCKYLLNVFIPLFYLSTLLFLFLYVISYLLFESLIN